jgi:NAD(P)-dependent dehydrogenase (short-subunit alcohol dehydrogenase family)
MKARRSRPLVTGGAGPIGSCVARYCLNVGHQVVVLDDLSGGFRGHLSAGAKFIKRSVVAHERIARLFEQCFFDYVYHLAAYANTRSIPVITASRAARKVVNANSPATKRNSPQRQNGFMPRALGVISGAPSCLVSPPRYAEPPARREYEIELSEFPRTGKKLCR